VLRANQLEIQEGPLMISRSLFNLDISFCNIKYINSYTFTNLPSLRHLDLSGNPIVHIKEKWFDSLINIAHLKLNGCGLLSIQPRSFASMQFLRFLELADNSFKNAVNWSLVTGQLGRLESLNLRNTSLSNIQLNAFSKNNALRHLFLSGNNLSAIKASHAVSIDNLVSLDLSDCNLPGGFLVNGLKYLSKLKILKLSNNKFLPYEIENGLKNLSNLEYLYLSNCGLSDLHPDTFNSCSKLQHLDLSLNSIKNLHGLLNPLKNIKHLDLSHSDLVYISKANFHGIHQLKTLILRGNTFYEINSDAFCDIKSLETLVLEKCMIYRVKSGSGTCKNKNLENVNLSRNPLYSITDNSLPKSWDKVKNLDLSYCQINIIEDGSFIYFSNIFNLNLRGNNLKGTNFKFLRKLPYLVDLDLRDNNLAFLKPHNFINNLKLKNIRLEGNPWLCNCFIPDMWEWSLASRKSLGSELKEPHQAATFLTCSHNTTGALIVKGQDARDVFSNKTWKKYIKESNCESAIRISNKAAYNSGKHDSLLVFPSSLIFPMIVFFSAFAIVGKIKSVSTGKTSKWRND